MDVWTAHNHKAFMAVTVHLEQQGEALVLLLDIVEVSKVQIHLLDCLQIEQIIGTHQPNVGGRVRKDPG